MRFQMCQAGGMSPLTPLASFTSTASHRTAGLQAATPAAPVQDHLLPAQYVKKMRDHALDRCPTSSYESLCRTFREDFGQLPGDMFASFEETPFASASLAQVHRAVMHDGRTVAVKVQHEGLQETAAADVATITCASQLLRHTTDPRTWGMQLLRTRDRHLSQTSWLATTPAPLASLIQSKDPTTFIHVRVVSCINGTWITRRSTLLIPYDTTAASTHLAWGVGTRPWHTWQGLGCGGLCAAVWLWPAGVLKLRGCAGVCCVWLVAWVCGPSGYFARGATCLACFVLVTHDRPCR